MKLATNRFAERAALALVFQLSDESKLWSLEEADFADPMHLLLLQELNGLVASGGPLGDATACSTWFTSPTAKARAKALGEDNLSHLAADVFGETVLPANWEYYISELRKSRLLRALQSINGKLREKIENAESDTALEWLVSQSTKLQEEFSEATA